jgi:hypothetical protein
MSDKNVKIRIGGDGSGGCLITILSFILIWAVCCGVTYEGKHYGIACTNEDGVRIDKGRAK